MYTHTIIALSLGYIPKSGLLSQNPTFVKCLQYAWLCGIGTWNDRMTESTRLPVHSYNPARKGRSEWKKHKAGCGNAKWRALRGAKDRVSFSLEPLTSGHDQILLNSQALCEGKGNLFSKFYALRIFSNVWCKAKTNRLKWFSSHLQDTTAERTDWKVQFTPTKT